MLKHMKLRGKIVFLIALTAFITFSVSIAVMTTKTHRMAKDEALAKGTEMAHRYANKVKVILEEPMEGSKALAYAFMGMKKTDKMPDRGVLTNLLKGVVENDANLESLWA